MVVSGPETLLQNEMVGTKHEPHTNMPKRIKKYTIKNWCPLKLPKPLSPKPDIGKPL